MIDRKHVIVRNTHLQGLEYGMLRDFEDEIARITQAEVVIVPKRTFPAFLSQRLEHGTRYSCVRSAIPKSAFDLKADVMWCILMSATDFTLDLFAGWQRDVAVKVLYLFDTFEDHLPTIKRVVNSADWDFTITSFPDAVPMLEAATKRQWYSVAQGVKLERFKPAATSKRVIDFAAYGRRMPAVHEKLKRYCNRTGKYYDYTTASAVQRLDQLETYNQYAWHVRHSSFAFCWPVEMTNSKRAGGLSPITCRWFETAAAGTVIVGQKPKDPVFDSFFGPGLVLECNPESNDMDSFFESLLLRREALLEEGLERRSKYAAKWSWEDRVHQILCLLRNDYA